MSSHHLDLAIAGICFTAAAGCFALAWVMREWSWWENSPRLDVVDMLLGDPYNDDARSLDNVFRLHA